MMELEQLARIHAAVQAGTHWDDLLRKERITRAQWLAAERAWLDALAAEASAGRWELSDRYLGVLLGGGGSPPAPSRIAGAPASSPSVERSQSEAVVKAPVPPAPPPLVVPTAHAVAPPLEDVSGTSLLFDPPRASALPFAPATSAAPPQTLASNKMPDPAPDAGGTLSLLNAPVRSALPFLPGAPAKPRPPAGPLEAEMERAADVHGTVVASDAAPVAAALPFRGRTVETPTEGTSPLTTEATLHLPDALSSPAPLLAKLPPGKGREPLAMEATLPFADVHCGPESSFAKLPPGKGREPLAMEATLPFADGLRGPAPSFAEPPTGERSEPKPQAPCVAETSPVLEPSRAAVLPFDRGTAAASTHPVPKIAQASPANEEMGTLVLFDPPRGLPPSGVRSPASQGSPAPWQGASKARSSMGSSSETAHFPFTLEQHAVLTLELALYPKQEREVLARHHLTPERKATLDQHFYEQISRSSEMRAAWNKAYHDHYAWLMQRGGAPR